MLYMLYHVYMLYRDLIIQAYAAIILFIYLFTCMWNTLRLYAWQAAEYHMEFLFVCLF